MRVKLKIYSEQKAFAKGLEKPMVITYPNVKSFRVLSRFCNKEKQEELKKLEERSDILDPNHSYLILTFTDGTQATFRNSYTEIVRA